MPYGTISAAATMGVFLVAHYSVRIPLIEQRTTAVVTLGGCSLLVLLRNARPLVGWKLGLVVAMGSTMAGAFLVPAGRRFFELQLPPLGLLVLAFGAMVGAGAAMLALHRLVREPFPGSR